MRTDLNILISTIDEAFKLHNVWATHTVSLVDPHGPDINMRLPGNHRLIQVADIESDPRLIKIPRHNPHVPSEKHLAQVFDFTQHLTAKDNLLIHCHAGKARSPAVAIAVLCQHGWDPVDAIDHVFMIRTCMWPNKAFINVADNMLQLNGRLVDATSRWMDKHVRFISIDIIDDFLDD